MTRMSRWFTASVCAVMLGVLGVASAPSASAASRTFYIVNHTSYSLTLTAYEHNGVRYGRAGCHGGDVFAPIGTVVPPGATYVYDMTYWFLSTCVAELTFTDNAPVRPSSPKFALTTNAEGLMWAVVTERQYFEVDNQGFRTGRIVLNDKK